MKPDSCVHFFGVQHKTCKAGVNYVEKFNTPNTPGMFLRMPCTEVVNRQDHAIITCGLIRYPTPEELAEDERETERMMRDFKIAHDVARKWRTKPKPSIDRREVIECPICNGRLHLSQSSYNGHVHGKCETADCVSWME